MNRNDLFDNKIHSFIQQTYPYVSTIVYFTPNPVPTHKTHVAVDQLRVRCRSAGSQTAAAMCEHVCVCACGTYSAVSHRRTCLQCPMSIAWTVYRPIKEVRCTSSSERAEIVVRLKSCSVATARADVRVIIPIINCPIARQKNAQIFQMLAFSRETMPSPHTQPHICHASARAIDRSRAFWRRPFGAQHRALQSKCRQTYDYTCVRRSWVNTNKGEPNTNKLFQPAQSAFFILNFLHNTQHSFLSIAA